MTSTSSAAGRRPPKLRPGEVSAIANPDLLVGVDFGTTACKAGIVEVDGSERGHARVPTPWRRVSTGAEIAPEALVDTAVAAIDAVLRQVPEGRVVGLGVTSMAETGVLLGENGQPVAPAIAWYDRRGEDHLTTVAAGLGANEYMTRTGLPLQPLATIFKYLWLRHHMPSSSDGRRWLNVSEWIVHRLGGEPVAERSLASRTGWFDVRSRHWWQEALQLSDAPDGLVADPRPAGASFGIANGTVPRVAGATLTVGGHDHLCAAIGAGATTDGSVFDSCGTAEAFIAQLAPPVEDSNVRWLVEQGITVGCHVIPDRYALLGAQRAGLGLERFLRLLGVDADGRGLLDDAALTVGPDADGMHVRDLDGATAALEGIGLQPSPGAVWRAALEAVAARGSAILRTMERVAGPSREIVLAGGWARDHAFRRVKQEHLPNFRHAAAVHEAGVRGAALLAGCAAGVYGSIDELPQPDEPAPRPES